MSATREEVRRCVERALAGIYRLRRQRDEAIRQRDELRAILVPLLLEPFRRVLPGERACLFCGFSGAFKTFPHNPDCPVLRAATLLGRDRTPAHAEGDAT